MGMREKHGWQVWILSTLTGLTPKALVNSCRSPKRRRRLLIPAGPKRPKALVIPCRPQNRRRRLLIPAGPKTPKALVNSCRSQKRRRRLLIPAGPKTPKALVNSCRSQKRRRRSRISARGWSVSDNHGVSNLEITNNPERVRLEQTLSGFESYL